MKDLIQKQINEIKPKLAEAETAYAHSIASGDLYSIPKHRKTIKKYRDQIGKLIKRRIAQ
tara:strand:- start:323 stop:502 length:180 start_codon:yes stop_codon:yes gene_type:complete